MDLFVHRHIMLKLKKEDNNGYFVIVSLWVHVCSWWFNCAKVFLIAMIIVISLGDKSFCNGLLPTLSPFRMFLPLLAAPLLAPSTGEGGKDGVHLPRQGQFSGAYLGQACGWWWLVEVPFSFIRCLTTGTDSLGSGQSRLDELCSGS